MINFNYITRDGHLTINFNQDMTYPELPDSTPINQTMYNFIFEITVRSQNDGQVYKGKF